MLSEKLKQLNLIPEIISVVEKIEKNEENEEIKKYQNYFKNSTTQENVIPEVFQGKDLLVIASTGVDKNFSFLLPIIQNLNKQNLEGIKEKNIKVFILSSAKNTIKQIHEDLDLFTQDLNIKSATVFGGVSANRQIENIKYGVDILIAAPRRLLEFQDQDFIDLSKIDFLIINEFEHLLETGVLPIVEEICSKLPENRQTLIYSKIFNNFINNSALKFLKNLKVIQTIKNFEKTESENNFKNSSNDIKIIKTPLSLYRKPLINRKNEQKKFKTLNNKYLHEDTQLSNVLEKKIRRKLSKVEPNPMQTSIDLIINSNRKLFRG